MPQSVLLASPPSPLPRPGAGSHSLITLSLSVPSCPGRMRVFHVFLETN